MFSLSCIVYLKSVQFFEMCTDRRSQFRGKLHFQMNVLRRSCGGGDRQVTPDLERGNHWLLPTPLTAHQSHSLLKAAWRK